MNNHFDISARLLANENITVLRRDVKTASFDIESRKLTLPVWSVDQDIDQMLVGHEVGHALYTTNEYITEIESADASGIRIHPYLNVIEDVRIERLIKSRYPGIRGIFKRAYDKLNDMDFFGLSKIDLNTLTLIDRINVKYKAGVDYFHSEEEVALAERAMTVSTIQEVINLAYEVYEYDQREQEQPQQGQGQPQQGQGQPQGQEQQGQEQSQNQDQDQQPQGQGQGQPQSQDQQGQGQPQSQDQQQPQGQDQQGQEQSQSQDQDQQPQQGQGQPQQPQQPQQGQGQPQGQEQSNDQGDSQQQPASPIQQESKQPITQDLFDKSLEGVVETGFETLIMDNEKPTCAVIKYQDVLAEVRSITKGADKAFINQEVNGFIRYTKKAIDSMATEFETRKSASRFRHNSQAKTGRVDVRKLWSYKTKDDIFRQISVSKDEKNHGLVVMVDWSGSVRLSHKGILKQVAILAHFCRRVKIPFKVFAFADTNQTLYKYVQNINPDVEEGYIRGSSRDSGLPHTTALVELLNDSMTNAEFMEMIGALIDQHTIYGVVGLGSTPLITATSNVIPVMESFIKSRNIEKSSLVIITDGSPTDLLHTSVGYKTKVSVVDPITKKSYTLDKFDSISQLAMTLEMAKDRLGCDISGFFIAGRYEIGSNILRMLMADADKRDRSKIYKEADELVRKARKGEYIRVDVKGYDSMYVVSKDVFDAGAEEAMEVSSDMRANQIAKKFSKNLNSTKNLSKMLNDFVKKVA